MKFVRLDNLKNGPRAVTIWEQLEDVAQDGGICMEGTVPFLGLWDGKQVIGAVWIEDVRHGGIWNVSVLSKFQGGGHGAKLVEELHKLAKKLGFEFLQCDPINPIIGKMIVKKYNYKPYETYWRLTLK